MKKCENCANYIWPKCTGADIPDDCDNFKEAKFDMSVAELNEKVQEYANKLAKKNHISYTIRGYSCKLLEGHLAKYDPDDNPF